jgi:hypothetical protein
MEWWKEPFFQVALPIMVSFAFATWFQSKRIDDLGKRIDDLKVALSKRLDSIEQRLVSIESLLKDHDRRITTLEARTPPIYTR